VGPQGPQGEPGITTPSSSSGTPNTLVLRDGLGSFAANGLVLTGRLQATSNNGMVATGTYGLGTIPEQNAGVRMMWYPRRAAFRAGAVEPGSAMGGAEWNDANIGDASVAMGTNTMASGLQSVAMGINSRASAQAAFAIGYGNIASGLGSFALGFGTTATNEGATATGYLTTASGRASTAMGYAASTNGQDGSFVYGDFSTFSGGALVTSTAPNQFVVRAAGGTTFYSNSGLTAGVSLPAGGGAWADLSDRNRKQDFRELDLEETLERVRQIPITEWSYIAQGSSVRHIGPMAQDFRAAFGLGTDDVTITGSDMNGVNMLAIQALADRTDKLRAENAELRDEVAELKRRLERLEALLSRP
jgi:hypothetical protein